MTTNTMGRDEAGKDIRKRAMEGCPLARELLILRGMCSCQGDEKSVDDAEDRYLELAVLRDAVPALQAEVEALRAELASLRTDRDGAAEACRMLQEDKARLEQDNARLRGQISAMLGELEDFAMQNDLPIEDGHGYFGTGLPLRALQEWLFRQKDALAGGDA